MSVGRPRWTWRSTCSTACRNWGARSPSAPPDPDGVGVSAAAPMIRAPRWRARLRQREDEFVEWVLRNPPLRLPGAAAIFSAASTGIPLGLTHHLRHNRVLHERVLFVCTVESNAPRIEPSQRVKLVPVGAGITRVILCFGFMEEPYVIEGLK